VSQSSPLSSTFTPVVFNFPMSCFLPGAGLAPGVLDFAFFFFVLLPPARRGGPAPLNPPYCRSTLDFPHSLLIT
jgi:hypothetical protein